jgi:predicted dehydrogenase
LTLRGVLLGAGNIAQNGHLPAYQKLSRDGERCEIIAVADLCSENLNRVSMAAPGIRTFCQPQDVFDELQPDFVDICAPPFAHRDLVELAINRGCHVFCEKPLTLNLDDGLAIAEALSARPLVFMPGHQYHFAPAWVAIQQVVRSGEIGVLQSGSITIERQAANAGNKHWKPDWRTSERLSGGGILMDHGTHLFYQLESLFGRPLRVSAGVQVRRHHSYGVEDTAWCELDFDRGRARLDLTWAGAERRSLHEYRGSNGTIACDEECLQISGNAGQRSIPLAQGFSGDSSHADWYVPLLDEFLTRIERRDYGRGPLEEALLALRCTTAAYASARIGAPVELD